MANPSAPAAEAIIQATQDWLTQAVIGLNLCPFAKAVHVKNLIRYAVSPATTPDDLAKELAHELQLLHAAAPEDIDTTLLIHPDVLTDFFDYNDFLAIADEIIDELGLTGEIQIASFHPDYQFADEPADAIENYTNRSPYPMLHLLRESSLDLAVSAFPDASEIFEKNMETMRGLGLAGWQALKSGK